MDGAIEAEHHNMVARLDARVSAHHHHLAIACKTGDSHVVRQLEVLNLRTCDFCYLFHNEFSHLGIGKSEAFGIGGVVVEQNLEYLARRK